MPFFNWFNPTEVFFGVDALKQARALIEEKGFRRPLLVCGKTATRELEIVKTLSREFELFCGVEQNPCAGTVDAVAEKVNGKDCVIAVGGGSVLDAAKAGALVCANGGTTQDYLDGKSFKTKSVPCIAIPTTSGTSSEITQYAVITDERVNRKKALKSRLLYPIAAIEDPSLSYSMPPAVTASTGLDAFCHCVESIVNKETNPLSEALALKGLAIIKESLPASVKGDKSARDRMTLAVVFAGLAFDRTGTTAAHKISYALTLGYGVLHGFACALTLPYLTTENAVAEPEKVAAIEAVLGGSAEEKMLELLEAVGAPTRLSALGVKKEDLAGLLDSIQFSEMPHDVLPVTRERVQRVLERIC